MPVVEARNPDLVLLDLQIGNMGGVAACLAIRQEEGAGRLARRPIALFLDRSADVFLAQQSRADGWLIKPIDSLRLRRTSKRLLSGENVFEGLGRELSQEPVPTVDFPGRD